MNKQFRKVICTLLAVVLMAALLPVMPASAAGPDPTAAYTAYKEMMELRESQIGQPIFSDDFYNIVTTDKRDAKLDEIDSFALVDLTNDGIKDLIVKYYVNYNYEKYGYPRGTSWTLVYTYDQKSGELVKIGEAPYWMVKVSDDAWSLHYQDDFIGVGDLYICKGADGKNYICDDLPFVSDTHFSFYGYNGIHIAEIAEFYANFIPDRWYGIALNTGRYEYKVNGKVVSGDYYRSLRDKYYAGGYERLKMTEYKDFWGTIDGELDRYREQVEFEKANPFHDVKYGDYFALPVLWAKENGITSGTNATTFAPNAPCTRGQVVTFLHRAAGQPAPQSTENPFKDVKPSDFYYEAVLWAVEQGITSGVGKDTFAPNALCTRGQIVTFLHRAMDCPNPSRNYNPFDDVTALDFYYKAVLWAVEQEITSGTSKTTFSPYATCTRGQVVTFLSRAYKDYVVPTPKPTPTPSPKPVVTPKPEDKEVCDGVSTALKDKILGSGITDVNGYPILNMTREFEGRELISIVAYLEDTNQFLFTDRMVDEALFTDTTMLIDASNPTTAAITFDCDVTGIVGGTTISVKDYNQQTEATFTYTPQGVYPDNEVQYLCNLTIDTAMLGWEALLQKNFGPNVSMGDLGFIAWEKELNPNWVEGTHSFSGGICTKCGCTEPN